MLTRPPSFLYIIGLILLTGCPVTIEPEPPDPQPIPPPPPGAYCGDEWCDWPWEDNIWCPEDCPPIPDVYCGNGICEAGETMTTCWTDCAPRAHSSYKSGRDGPTPGPKGIDPKDPRFLDLVKETINPQPCPIQEIDRYLPNYPEEIDIDANRYKNN